MSITFARKPFAFIKSPAQYDAGKSDQQITRVVQSIPSTKTVQAIADYTVTTSDRWVSGDTTAGNFSVTLPFDPTQVANLEVTITNVGTGTLTVTGTVSGSLNPTLAQWHSITVVSDGVRYLKTASV